MYVIDDMSVNINVGYWHQLAMDPHQHSTPRTDERKSIIKTGGTALHRN